MSDAPIPAGGSPEGTPPRPTPRQTARLTTFLTVMLAPAMWLGYSGFWVPRLKQTGGHLIVPEGWISVLLCALIGFGIALLLAIGILNRHRVNLMFRPTGTKLVAMCLFGMLAPIGLFGAVPIGGWAVLLWFFNPIRLAESARALETLGLAIALLVVSYAIVSLVLYGIRSYAVRGILLVALWLSLYAARILFAGVYSGPL